MKKLVYYLIFLLALVMMVLCSSACRSPKTMTTSKATTDSVRLSMKDSTAQRFEFTFDSLELWLPDLLNFETSEQSIAPIFRVSEPPKFRSFPPPRGAWWQVHLQYHSRNVSGLHI